MDQMDKFTRCSYNVRDYGAAGDGKTLDTHAIQVALDACEAGGGGTVFFPAGRYLSGSLVLHSNVTLYIDAGAVLLGSVNPMDYPVIFSRWEGRAQETHAPLIGGHGLSNIAVAGRGMVDGCGQGWWQRYFAGTLDYPRPRLISFDGCSNVLVEGLTITQSPSWSIHPLRCDNVTLKGLTILNPPDSPNTDGLDLDSCSSVHIADCYVDVGDDCIALKSGIESQAPGDRLPCQNITITNCTLAHGHGGVVIGSEMSGDVRNVVISNCVFAGTDRGIRLKSRRRRGGIVENILATNLVMTGVLCPFTLNLHYHVGARGDAEVSDKAAHPITDGTPRFRGIHFSHITARDVIVAAAYVSGLAEMPVEDISLEDISIEMAPQAEPARAEMADNSELMERAGLFICNAHRLRIHNLQVTRQLGPALRLEAASQVEISDSTVLAPSADTPVLKMVNVDGAFVHGCQAAQGTEVFLSLEGEKTKDIVLRGNHLARAHRPLRLEDEVPREAVSTDDQHQW
jgi:polygalacturonase